MEYIYSEAQLCSKTATLKKQSKQSEETNTKSRVASGVSSEYPVDSALLSSASLAEINFVVPVSMSEKVWCCTLYGSIDAFMEYTKNVWYTV